jgi:hypothetical protein
MWQSSGTMGSAHDATDWIATPKRARNDKKVEKKPLSLSTGISVFPPFAFPPHPVIARRATARRGNPAKA